MAMWRRKKAAAPPDPELAARFDAVLDDVRAEADRILAEARRKAETTADVDQAIDHRRLRLLELYDTLIARAELVLARLDDAEAGRESLERMTRALAQAAEELTLEVTAAVEPDRSGLVTEGRERAIQMAAGGSTRNQVEAHLREFSELGNPNRLLDEVFGPASDGDTRVPWAVAPGDDA
jgi:hypothetical protein